MKNESGQGQKLQVREQLESIETAKNNMEDAIADLGIRLAIVLIEQEAPSEDDSKKEDSPPLVYLADELRQTKNKINVQVDILRGYLKRLQLP